MQSFAILVVEDHETIRRFFCSELQQRADFRVVGEASDGLEAIRLASELQPDLILFDIGLPKLNGIEAARQIHRIVPQTKFLFVSLESSPDVVRRTNGLGRRGYIHKMHAQTDLLPAVDALLGGRQFVSSDVGSGERRHEVQFYSDDAVLIDKTALFIANALKAGDAAVVVATESHHEGFSQKLKEMDIDMERAVRRGTYVAKDAADVVSTVAANGVLDRGRFIESMASVIESAARATGKEYPGVAVFGECAGLLCAAGNLDAAIQIEKTGNDVIQRARVHILCGYPLSVFHLDEDDNGFVKICTEHTAVFAQ